MKEAIIYVHADLPAVASTLLKVAGSKKIWLFKGEMGTGKTTLIKELCRQLEVTSAIASPTFSLVNTYETKNGKPIYHFDLYRLKKANELAAIGFAEYVDSGNFCFIEWPEFVENVLENTLVINIGMHGDGRILTTNL